MMILETQRTIVQRMSLADAAFLLQLVNSPGWLRFIGDRNVHNVLEAEAYLTASFLRSYTDNGFGYYVIKNRSDDPIGICGFLKKPDLENEDFGFALLPEFHGLGYGIESASAIFEYGVKEFGFDVVDAVTDAENKASQVLLGKLGFEFVGPHCVAKAKQESKLFRWTNQ